MIKANITHHLSIAILNTHTVTSCSEYAYAFILAVFKHKIKEEIRKIISRNLLFVKKQIGNEVCCEWIFLEQRQGLLRNIQNKFNNKLSFSSNK
jgi:hypothetical protein